MTEKPNDTAIEDLNTILDAEREALLEGDLEKLATMLATKTSLIDTLNSEPQSDLVALERLDRKVRRNQLLLDGALEGIRSVSSKLAKLREVRGTLETYGADGKRHDIVSQPETSVERRA